MPESPRRLLRVFREAAALALTGTAVLSFAAPASAQAPAPDPTNVGIEAKVRATFADAPVMVDVARCESSYMQYNADGSVLHGGAGKQYVGIFQIGLALHTAPAAKLGHDIMTIDGNIAYARHLYEARGSRPWLECVPKGTAATTGRENTPAVSTPVSASAPAIQSLPAPAVGETPVLTADLTAGASSEQVRAMQRILNRHGYAVAASGPGSPSNETSLFGALTRDAVRRFQCAAKLVCDGDEATTGYGRVGPRTRAALNSL